MMWLAASRGSCEAAEQSTDGSAVYEFTNVVDEEHADRKGRRPKDQEAGQQSSMDGKACLAVIVFLRCPADENN